MKGFILFVVVAFIIMAIGDDRTGDKNTVEEPFL